MIMKRFLFFHRVSIHFSPPSIPTPGALPPDPWDSDRAGKAEKKTMKTGWNPSPIFIGGGSGGATNPPPERPIQRVFTNLEFGPCRYSLILVASAIHPSSHLSLWPGTSAARTPQDEDRTGKAESTAVWRELPSSASPHAGVWGAACPRRRAPSREFLQDRKKESSDPG
ncbi:hypothetical protein J2129_001488 [Methanofollis sp. W23]|nr:hypothetical protein [Methanofollis sp. W23]